jgi:hypothetical protein
MVADGGSRKATVFKIAVRGEPPPIRLSPSFRNCTKARFDFNSQIKAKP